MKNQTRAFSLKPAVVLAAALGCSLAEANTTYYLRNDCSESSSYKSSIRTAAAWNTATDAKGTNASAIDATGDFVVELWRYLRIQYYLGETFTGNSLTIDRGYLFWYDACDKLDSDASVIFKTGGLIVYRKSDNSRSSFNADVRFQKPVDQPFGVYPGGDKNNSWVHFTKKFASDADVTVPVGYGRQGCASAVTGFRTLLTGDYSDFLGSLVVTSANASVTYPAYGAALSFGDSAKGFPGQLTVTKNCVLSGLSCENTQQSAGIVKIAGLTLAAGSAIHVGAVSEGFEAMDSLYVEGPVRIRLAYAQPAATPNRIAVLKAPAAGILKLEDFELDRGLSTSYGAETAGLALSPDGRTLWVEFRTTVTMETSDASDMTKSGQTSALSPGHGSQWSDGAEPHELAVYTLAYPKLLRTPEDSNLDCVFSGSLLKMGIGTSLVLQSKSFEANVVYDGTWGNLMGVNLYGSRYLLKGELELKAGTITVQAMNSCTIQIDSAIRGSGSLDVHGRAGTSAPSATTELMGDNSAWMGKLLVAQNAGTSGTQAYPSLARFQTLRVNDARSLGGKLEAMAYDAFVLQDYSLFGVTNSVTLAEGTNRGLMVLTNGQINVAADAELSVQWPLTLDGRLFKNGVGMLTLGGPAKFRSGTAVVDQPSAGQTNELLVTAGTLKVASCDSVNGFTLSLGSAATPLALDFNPADADLKRYGIRNVKTGLPFAVGTKVYLRLDGVDDAVIAAARTTDAGYKQGLFTVKTSAANALRANLVFTKPARTRVIREDDAATGTTTFSLFGKDNGLSVIIR